MSFNIKDDHSDDSIMSEINMTPMVDVMLVLLIIFLITVPVITKTIPLELPNAANIPTETKPENITVAIDKEGKIFWNLVEMPSSEALLEEAKKVSVLTPQPEVHIRADARTDYAAVAKVVLACVMVGVFVVALLV